MPEFTCCHLGFKTSHVSLSHLSVFCPTYTFSSVSSQKFKGPEDYAHFCLSDDLISLDFITVQLNSRLQTLTFFFTPSPRLLIPASLSISHMKSSQNAPHYRSFLYLSSLSCGFIFFSRRGQKETLKYEISEKYRPL